MCFEMNVRQEFGFIMCFEMKKQGAGSVCGM